MQPASMVRRNPVSKLNPLEPARANWVPVPTSGHSSFTWWHLMVGAGRLEGIVRRQRDRK